MGTISQTTKLLKEINSFDDTHQCFTNPTISFTVSLPAEENLIFGEELSLDLNFIDGKVVLYIVDTATRFSAETFLYSHGAKYKTSIAGL